MHQLVDVIGLPRQNAFLGVVRFSNGFFHPKTVLIRYCNGREVAYVGSANLTARGINGLNVEAGVILDTDEGDSIELLDSIRLATNQWFTQDPVGLFRIENHENVDQLESRGILTSKREQRRPEPTAGDESEHDPLPRRAHHHTLPSAKRTTDEDKTKSEQRSGPDGDVLIAELAGPGRWGQAAFPQWFIENFFKVLPDSGDTLQLLPVRENGIGTAEERPCGYKEGSKNWYYELGMASEVGAYTKPHKPIGIFHCVGYQSCRYTILMPSDNSYRPVSDFLAANRNRLGRSKNELPRTIVPAVELRDAWPDSWFFEV